MLKQLLFQERQVNANKKLALIISFVAEYNSAKAVDESVPFH